MNTTKSIIAVLSFVSIVPMCAMENQKNNVISDEDLLVRKKAFALQFKNQKQRKREMLDYPEGSEIKINLEVLNKELELQDSDKIFSFGDMFVIPEGMDEKFIHKTLVPKRVADFGIKMVV